MAITTRQTNLLVNQDWKTLYQTFREADFQSYDFETLRKSMIDYLRTYYPEDFNDFTESSEYIALIDLIAFLGQSLAFRTDLNARENFLDTAERRDSILKLARLISYNPKRNVPASGLLKIDSVSTSESVFDSNGLNLANLVINWNDTANPDWQEQMTAILNASLVASQVIGNPGNSQSINNIQTDEYAVNLVRGVVATYSFSSIIEGNKTAFEAVSATTSGQNYIYEADPTPKGRFNILYRNDNLGNGSNNTGYFLYFKQGSLSSQPLNLQQSLPNRVVNVNHDNINNSDLWLYELNTNGTVNNQWTQVPAVSGLNIIYNKQSQRNLFQVNTRANDQVDLVFGDGSFSNVPQGNFRVYYRNSNGRRYKITPDEMQGIVIPLSYVSRNNRIETITIRASLHYTVANADVRELINDIRTKAPQQYYTQNRMITGEDYNLFPYTNFNSILKVKAVNRTSSGISRYLDVLDATGKYSSTNVFSADGWIYKETPQNSTTFTFSTVNDINNIIYSQLKPILSSIETKQFYYANFTRYNSASPTWPGTVRWIPNLYPTNQNGYLMNASATIYSLGLLTNNDLKYIAPGAILKFRAGPNDSTSRYFDSQNIIRTGTPAGEGDRSYIYATVITNNGGNIIKLNEAMPVPMTGATAYPELVEIIPVFKNDIPNTTFTDQIVALIKSYKNFGLRYDTFYQSWKIIQPQDLNTGAFSLAHQGDVSNTGLDSSWVVAFTYNGSSYNLVWRSQRYVFESLAETRFYFDPEAKVYDSKTGLTLHDQINVLRSNSQPDSALPLGQEQKWFIYDRWVENDGFANNTKVLITFPDSNNDGIPDNPDIFTNLVTTDVVRQYVFFQSVTNSGNFTNFVPVDNKLIVTKYATATAINADISLYTAGQIFYATTANKFYQLVNNSLTELTDYIARVGRQMLGFQYRHNSPNNRRIDPSPNNIMDLYILTKQYATDYMAWIRDTSNTLTAPTLPTNEELKQAYGSGATSLENYKALSDTIVYNSGKFKPVFGLDLNKVPLNLQATFKVVKNPNVTVSDNDIKTSVISAINTYFDSANWDFGETFYFSELSTYLHNALTPNIASIIIVPSSTDIAFGSLMQINANPDEVIVSAATVDNVEIISAITAAQLNQNLTGIVN